MLQALLQLLLTLRARGGFTVTITEAPCINRYAAMPPWWPPQAFAMSEALPSTYCDFGIVYFRINIDD